MLRSVPVFEVVATLLLERLRRLGYAERLVLMRASVIGQRFDIEVLGPATPIPDGRLRTALDILCSLEFVVRDEANTDCYAFRHALIWKIAYEECVATGLRPIHRKIARALECQYAGDDSKLGDLAYHAWAAGDAARSMRYNELAGDRARRSFAHDEARSYYERARAFAQPNSRHYRRLGRKLYALTEGVPVAPGTQTEERQSSSRRDSSTRSLPAVRWTPR